MNRRDSSPKRRGGGPPARGRSAFPLAGAFLVGAALTAAACTDTVDALTSHARPVAKVAGHGLPVDELARILADSELPDSALTAHWAQQIGRLWADYVGLARLFQEPDSTRALDYDFLLQEARYYPALLVQRYRDSVVLAGIEPTDAQLREYYETAQPLTRLDVRRIRLGVPEGATDAVRDSLLDEARRLRDRVAGGADFVEVARTASDEPAAARGQILAYQGHDDFPPAADSIVFGLRPAEISPVIATEEEMVFYRIERRRTPELESVTDMVRRRLTDERRTRRLATAADSLLGDSRRIVADGAEDVARRLASSSDLGAGRISGALRLVRYEGGEFTVRELRLLLQARPDLRREFAEADDEQIGLFLYQIAGDEVLIEAASGSGVALSEEVREEMREAIAGQLRSVARRMDITHALVVNPAFNLETESRRWLREVLARAAPVPWLPEFRAVLDQRFETRVDERGAEAAARRAREMRGVTGEAAADGGTGHTEPSEGGATEAGDAGTEPDSSAGTGEDAHREIDEDGAVETR